MNRKIISRLLACVLSTGLIATSLFTSPLPAYAAGANCGGLEEVDVYFPGEDEVITDPVLHWAIRSALNSIKERPKLTAELIGSQKVDYVSYESGAHPENFTEWKMPYTIQSLEGLQYAKNLTNLDISYSDVSESKPGVPDSIKDLSPLKDLTQMTVLKLYSDGITDISALSALTNLKDLNLYKNKIADISAIENMKKLTKLTLKYNEIEDVSVISGLTDLDFLDISNNKITELPDMSGLTNVTFLDISGNSIGDKAVGEIGKMTNLRKLTIGKEANITDYKPLVNLVNLTKEETFLPCDNSIKDDLFAAINVNGLLLNFNISKMTEDDIPDVETALAAYDELSESQKAYIDKDRIDAARNNMNLINNGQEPVYYEKYDQGGGVKAVLNRMEVQVVDKYGKGISGVTVTKQSVAKSTFTTDSTGRVRIPHEPSDVTGECSISIDDDSYICKPARITYEVNSDIKTYIVNGKRATGFEEHKFVLVPKDGYVDHADLETAISECSNVLQKYKYTPASYSAYSEAMKNAKSVAADPDAEESAVTSAASDLRAAYENLTPNEVLTTLRVHVRDKNGNPFVRDFKLQVYTQVTKADPWNIWAYEGNDYAELEVSPAWQDGKKLEIACCNHEAYAFGANYENNIKVEIGVKDDGTRYFKTVNGEPVDGSFEIEVTAEPIAQAIDPANEIKPDGSRIPGYIEKAREYKEEDYTAASFKTLEAAISDAEKVVEKSSATQEEYNQAGADINDAIDKLQNRADNLKLELALRDANNHNKTLFTAASWEKYSAKVSAAKKIYENTDATQEEVDDATAELKSAENLLVLKASSSDRQILLNSLNKAKQIVASEYYEGYEAVARAIEEGQKVYENSEATYDEVNDATTALNESVNGLKTISDYHMRWNQFRARAIDKDGKGVAGAVFKASLEDGTVLDDSIKTGPDGVLIYEFDQNIIGKKIIVELKNRGYKTGDSHYFELQEPTPDNFWTRLKSVDGSSSWGDMQLVYNLTLDHEHAWSEYEAVTPATCTKTGVETRTCEICDETESKEIPATGHKYGDWKEAEKATCTEAGTEERKCANCDETESKEIPATGHKYGDWKEAEKATCTEAGYEERKCENCDETETREIPATGHKMTHKKSAPKIGIKGSEWDECTECGNKENERSISALRPSTTKITSLKAGRKSFAVKWAKRSYTGYEVRYSVKSSMSSPKYLRVSKKTTVSGKVSKLKAKKKYYVQVRTYKTVSGNKVYSAWSSKKSVRTK